MARCLEIAKSSFETKCLDALGAHEVEIRPDAWTNLVNGKPRIRIGYLG